MKRLLSLLFVFVAASPAAAQTRSSPTLVESLPHITMVGTARTEVQPDLATITLGVVTQAQNARSASDDNARRTGAVVDAAKQAGIANTDIATQALTLNQLVDDVPDPNGGNTLRKPRGFEATNIISIRIRDLTKAGSIAQTLIEKGANRFDGIEFTVAHPEPILAELTSEAIKNAEQIARTSAEAAGVHLGEVLVIQRAGGYGAASTPARFGMARAKTAPTPIEAGSTELSAEMEVTWAIAPR